MSNLINPTEEMVGLYNELYEKVKKAFQKDPNIIERLRSINDDVEELQEKIEEFIDDLDRGCFHLSRAEMKRMEQRDTSARALERVKPLMLLSLIMESMQEEKFDAIEG